MKNLKNSVLQILKIIIRLNHDLSNVFEKRFPFFSCPDSTRAEFKLQVTKITSAASACSKKLKILEIGSTDRPFLRKSEDYEYHGLDIEPLNNAEDLYDKFITQSIECKLDERYDLIISRMVIEHVRNNNKSWRTMYEALKPGGIVIHVFPGSCHPFSIANRIVGNKMQRILIRYLRPNAEHTGYPAFYHLCTPKELKKELTFTGFQNIRINYSYAALCYFKFCFPAYLAIAVFNLVMNKLKVSNYASNLYVEAQKLA